MSQKPEIVVESDFDGYFERLTRKIVDDAAERGHEFKHKKAVVSAGPWRAQALRVVSLDAETVSVDYYSALRTGFGALSEDDTRAAGELL